MARDGYSYSCEADREWHQARAESYTPVDRFCIVRKPVYLGNKRLDDMPHLWQPHYSSSTIDYSNWEKSCVELWRTYATIKKQPGSHAIDWCSTNGLSSWFLGHGHQSVTTIECNDYMMHTAKMNLKILKTDFYEQQFIEIDCNKLTAVASAVETDWTPYDTVRIGSSNYRDIYRAIRPQLDNCKRIMTAVYDPEFGDELMMDDWQLVPSAGKCRAEIYQRI